MASGAANPLASTVSEYLRLDEEAEDVRYEWLNHEVYALAGAHPNHSLIKDNVRTEVHTRLGLRGCRSFTSGQRVPIGSRYVYPDVVVVCADPEYTDENPPSLRNPEVLVEVTSSSTRTRDHEDKLAAYTQLASYWIIAADRPFVVQYVRHDDTWTIRATADPDAVLHSDTLGVDLPMGAIYTLVDFEAAAGSVEDVDEGGKTDESR